MKDSMNDVAPMRDISVNMNMDPDALPTLVQKVQHAYDHRSEFDDDCIEFAADLQVSWMADGVMGDRTFLCPDFAAQRALIPKRKKVMLWS